MEKILAFFISGFLVSSVSGGVTYKPILKSPKLLAFFESLVFGVEP
ncbi:hypothetical protein HPSA20_0809 [Helicobacter pylori SouthAfrica20]|uniref:Uncharacterized protein n=1 Tax=Helicobacter pylori SouthAfrica20 TaxID=1352356 RepID=T1U9J5_HELPX|nr:hypothetical protein HPSA20_0809 [Helicobacter pylori SouthAfrica20]